jgi:serine/threonine protein phosphatase PrpC
MPSAAIVRPTLLAAAGSHPGLLRENNEDRYHCDASRGIFMVIDGVGGHAAGEKAADTALTMIRARLERETGAPAERVREAITLANNEIYRLAATEPSWAGMACVLTVALVKDGVLTVGHVGDTRLYAIRNGTLAKVTHDHSPVGEREDRGEIDEAEAMRHPRRNEIYRDVGSQHHEPADPEFIETLTLAFDADTALVLCTDGLSDLVPSARLARIVFDDAADPALVVERLIEAANEGGGKDNITAVYVAGPLFPEAARQRGPGANAAETSHATGSAAVAARLVGSALTSRPALFAYGLVAGLALAGALMVSTDVVPDRVLDVSRPQGWARTWTVGSQPEADFAGIGPALDRAAPGDVVEVDAGTYDLPITVPPGVHLVSRRSREAILRWPAGAAQPQARGLSIPGRSRVAGFKIDAAGGAADAVFVQDDEADLEDLEIVGAANAAVVFGPGSRGVLRASYLHDNPGAAVIVDAQALPRLMHNAIAANGKGTPGVTPPPRPATARGPAAPVAKVPAVVLRSGASAVLFGNIIAGNGEDQVGGLPAEKRADVLRDNVIGLAAAAGSSTTPQRRSPSATPRRR